MVTSTLESIQLYSLFNAYYLDQPF